MTWIARAGGVGLALVLFGGGFSGGGAVAADLPTNLLRPDFDAGVVAFLEGDHTRAAGHWWPLAEAGDAVAQFNLGSLYLAADGGAMPDTSGFTGDIAEAAWWLGKAARQGHGRAQYELAKIFRDGGGEDARVMVPADGATALRWLTAAAEQGHGPAQADLGLAYVGRGSGALVGLESNDLLAWQWLSLADEQGERAAGAALAAVSARLTVAERDTAARAAAGVSDRVSGRRR